MKCGHLTQIGGKCKNTKDTCRHHSTLTMKMKGSMSDETRKIRKTLADLARGNEDIVDEIAKHAHINTDEVEIFFKPFDPLLPMIQGTIIYNGNNFRIMDNTKFGTFKMFTSKDVNNMLSQIENTINNYQENKTHIFGKRGKILWKYSYFVKEYGPLIQITVFIKDDDLIQPVDGKPYKLVFYGVEPYKGEKRATTWDSYDGYMVATNNKPFRDQGLSPVMAREQWYKPMADEESKEESIEELRISLSKKVPKQKRKYQKIKSKDKIFKKTKSPKGQKYKLN